MGQTLRQISGLIGFPDRKTIYGWRVKHADFALAVDKATQMGDEAIMDEAQEIADNPKFDYVQRLAYHGPMPGWELNGDAIARSRAMIDIRKFRVGKTSQRYSDKVQVEVTDKTAILDKLAKGRARVAALRRDGNSNE
jgi:hypothetical protein